MNVDVPTETVEIESSTRSALQIRAFEQQASELARSVESVRRETLINSNYKIAALEEKARELASFVETTRQQTLAQADMKTEALEQKARDLAGFVERLRTQARLQSEAEIEVLGQQARNLAKFVETVRNETRLQSDAEIESLRQQAMELAISVELRREETLLHSDRQIAALARQARDLAVSVEAVRVETQLQSETEIAALGQQARDLAVSVESEREETLLQSDAETRLAERRLNAQRATTKALAESPDLDAALPSILAEIGKSLDCTSGAFWSLDSDADLLRLAQTWDSEPASESEDLPGLFRKELYFRGEGLAGQVWAAGEPGWSSTLLPNRGGQLLPDCGRNESLGGIAFPIICGDDVFGVMQFFSRCIHRPDSDVLSIMSVLGSQIGQFVEKKNAEKELRLFRTLIDHTTDGIEVIDPRTGRFLDVNEKACLVHGYTRKEYLKLSVCDIDPLVPSGQWEQFIGPHRAAGSQMIESRHRRKDGSTFPVEVNLNFIHLDRDYLVAVVRDITARKQLEEQFLQSQKMEAFGQLASGMAHDFNNLLTIISGSSELVLEDLSDRDPNQPLVLAIQEAGERAALLTRQLLAFSRRQVVQFQVVDLNDVIARTKNMLGRLIGENIKLATAPASDLKRIEVDAGQIEQVIMNLVVNARDAMPDGGEISVETSNVDLDESCVRNRSELKSGKHVVLTIADDGCGMTEEVKQHIFEPFYTTKEVGKGTGLGLATVFGIVKQSRGHIDVLSEVGLGTRIQIYFPAVEEISDSVAPPTAPTIELHGVETILLVEDDDGVRTMTRTVLQACGYEVLEAADGNAAIRLCQAYGKPIHLLITDVVMPQLGGRQLAEKLMDPYPTLRTLFISGYTDDVILKNGVLQSGVAFLQKPFSGYEIKRKVRSVLDNTSIECRGPACVLTAT